MEHAIYRGSALPCSFILVGVYSSCLPPSLPCSVPSFSFRERYMRYLREDQRIRAFSVGLGELRMAMNSTLVFTASLGDVLKYSPLICLCALAIPGDFGD